MTNEIENIGDDLIVRRISIESYAYVYSLAHIDARQSHAMYGLVSLHRFSLCHYIKFYHVVITFSLIHSRSGITDAVSLAGAVLIVFL